MNEWKEYLNIPGVREGIAAVLSLSAWYLLNLASKVYKNSTCRALSREAKAIIDHLMSEDVVSEAQQSYAPRGIHTNRVYVVNEGAYEVMVKSVGNLTPSLTRKEHRAIRKASKDLWQELEGRQKNREAAEQKDRLRKARNLLAGKREEEEDDRPF